MRWWHAGMSLVPRGQLRSLLMISLWVRTGIRNRGSRASDIINAPFKRLPYRREDRERLFLDLFLLLRLIPVDATLAVTYKLFEFLVDVHGLVAVLHQTSDSNVQIILAFEFAVDGSLHLSVKPHTLCAEMKRFLRAPTFFLRIFALLACIKISLATNCISCELHAKIIITDVILTGLAAAQHVAFRWCLHVKGFQGVLRSLVDLCG